MSMRCQRIGWGLAAAVVVSLASGARAQYPDRLSPQVNSLPGYQLLSTQNNYLRLDMRQPGIVPTYNQTGTAPNITTTQVGYSNYRGGRVYISTVNGDPQTTADDGLRLTPLSPYSTYSTVQLRFATSGGTTTTAITDAVYEIETMYEEVNDPTEDPIVSPPSVGANGLTFAWRVREQSESVATVATTGGTGFSAGTVTRNDVTTTNNGLAGATSNVVAEIRQTYRLVRDLVRIEVEVLNLSQADITVGVNTLVNGQFGSSTNDGTQFHVNTSREPLKTEFSFPSNRASDPAALKQLPASWRAFDNESNPGVVVGGIWKGGDIETDALSAGPPTAAMFVNEGTCSPAAFAYTPVYSNLSGLDWGTVTRWTNVRITPQDSKRFITYFGLAGSNTDIAAPYALSVEAPFSLGLATGDDPATATQETASHVYRQPNPFQVQAFLNNVTTRSLSNIAVSLALPNGFTLAGVGDTATKTVATLPVGSEQVVRWTVRSAANQTPGNHLISVSASGSGLNSKVIDREIGIPALPTFEFPNLTKRLDMISVPYDFANRDLEHVLGSLGSLGVTGGGNAAVARFNPETRSYAFFPDPFITNVAPGEGFWLYNGALATLSLPADRVEVPTTEPVTVGLTPTWNQLGCPYTVPVRLFDCEVVTANNQTKTFEQAVNAGLVRPVLYEYAPHPTDPTQPGTYTFSGDGNTVLNPWRGYWLRAVQGVSFVYKANSLIGPFRGQGKDFLALAHGWQIGLSAEVDGFQSQPVSLGQDATSRDAYDGRDVDLPPDVRGGSPARLAVVHGDWGQDSGLYLRDIRSANSRAQAWQVEATAAAPNQDVVLRWNLRGAPADVQFTLVDLQTGARRYMRTTSGYVYNTGPYGRARTFQVLAERRSRPSLAVPSMTATATRGRSANLAFTLTSAATVEVVIESPTGRRVRTLATEWPGVEGQNYIGWDGRDDEGRPVPSGPYRCRVLVHTSDGQQAVAERIVVLSR